MRRIPLDLLAKATGRSVRTVWRYATASGRFSPDLRKLRQGRSGDPRRHGDFYRASINLVREGFEQLLYLERGAHTAPGSKTMGAVQSGEEGDEPP